MTRPELVELQQTVLGHIEEEGLRPFAARIGVPLSVVRSAQNGRNLTADSLSLLTNALGLEFYVGTPRVDSPTPTMHVGPDALKSAINSAIDSLFTTDPLPSIVEEPEVSDENEIRPTHGQLSEPPPAYQDMVAVFEAVQEEAEEKGVILDANQIVERALQMLEEAERRRE